MPLRICLVTPFSWSQPHDVNVHVEGVAGALRRLGHDVTVLVSSNRNADLLAGRKALLAGTRADVVAVGRALPVSTRSTLAIPVGIRASLETALAQGDFDVVHGFEPGLPSLSYLALLHARTLTVATFAAEDRTPSPPRKPQRERLLGRVDALVATSDDAAAAAARRFPGDYTVVGAGVDTTAYAPGAKRRLVVVETGGTSRSGARAALAVLRDEPDWDVVLARTTPLAGRPSIPFALRDRTHVRSVRRPAVRSALLAETAVFVPALGGSARLRLEAEASGCAVADEPETLSAILNDERLRARQGEVARATAEQASFDTVATELDALYRRLGRRRRTRPGDADPLAGRDWIVADLHMHTNHSHDCSIAVPDLLDHAESEGLGAIAVTDHNVFGGAQEAAELARDRELIVIPGEEVKTDGQGEVIGLFLSRQIPRGMSFTDTIAAIREQEGIVYLPHPFDRMHAIPDPQTIHRHLPEIDVFEVYNARLLFEAYNDEALRFARKYGLLAGAGSDAHVLQGVGTGALRMRRFNDPEEFLVSLRTAEVLRRPKSLAYLQSLKWVAQVKEKVR